MKFSTDDDYGPDLFEPLSPGSHPLQITKTETKHNDKHNCPQIVLTISAIKPDPEAGKRFDYHIVCARESWGLGRLVKLCRALGVKGVAQDPTGLDPENPSTVASNLRGRTFFAKTRITTSPRRDGAGEYKNVDIVQFALMPASISERITAAYGSPTPPLPDPEPSQASFGNDQFSAEDIPF